MQLLMIFCRRTFIGLLLGLIVVFSGCNGEGAPAKGAKNSATKKSEPLVVLVVEDSGLGQAIAREWEGRTEEKLVVRAATIAEMDSAKRLPADAIIFPSGLIGQLAERGLIAPLATQSLEMADFNYRDIFDQLRLREMKWGDKTLAVTLGSPQLLLAYRSDIFEKLQIAPPQTWAEYQQAVVRLGDREKLGELAPPTDQPWQAALEPLAAGWAGQLLLARAASYAFHRDQVSPLFRFENMAPLVDQPPYVRALEDLVAAAKAASFSDKHLTPQQVFADLRAGRCGMALSWPAPEVGNVTSQPRDSSIRFAPLPGAAQAYRFATKSWDVRGEEESVHVPLLTISGRMAAVSATTAETQRSEAFVLWLAGREVCENVGPHSGATTLFRNSQLPAAGRWTSGLPPEASRQYGEVLAATLNLPRAFPGLTIPGRARYLEALDQAVADVLAGKKAAEALATVAKRWAEITEELGGAGQQRANARSLGQTP